MNGLFVFGLLLLASYAVADEHTEHSDHSDHRPAHHYHHSHNPPSPIVHTHSGRLRGLLVDVAPALQAYEFTGIPYAEAPIGHRRFEKPDHKHRWHHLFHADRPAKMCPQNEFPGRDDIDPTDSYYTNAHDQIHSSEDCLTLSIWAPKENLDKYNQGAVKLEDVEAKKEEKHHHHHHKLSVLAFFQAGGLGGGNLTEIDGRYLSAHNNIIVVTIRYRVGLLGFAHYQGIHSNLGLWDQLEALRWIHENIHHFGGDKHNVTIAGQGFSSTLVSLHLLSHRSRRYFHRAIVQSNTAISQPMGVLSRHVASELTEFYFHHIIERHCQNLPDTMNCLQHRVPHEAFVRVLLRKNPRNRLPMMMPVIDDHFLHDDPEDLLRDHHVYRAPLLIGVNKDEGTEFAALAPAFSRFRDTTGGDTSKPIEFLGMKDYARLSESLRRYYSFFLPFDRHLLRTVQYRYWPDEERDDNGFPQGDEVAQAVSSIFGDVAITCPAFRWAEKTTHRVHHVYAYYFTHRRPGTELINWMGVPTGSELPYVFGEPLSPKSEWLSYDDEDRALSKVMMAYWANFVKHGDPNGRHGQGRVLAEGDDSVKDLRYWPRFKSHQHECKHRFFEINPATVVKKTDEAVICRLKENDCNFWHKHIPRLDAEHDHDWNGRDRDFELGTF